MKRINKIGYILSVGALLICLVSLPVASANTDINGLDLTDKKTQSIYALENEMISQIQKPADYTRNLTEAKK